MGLPSIPVIDLDGPTSPGQSVFAALREFGFVALRGHGIQPDLVTKNYQAAADFFALPVATKQRYHLPDGGGARGYTPFGIEKARDQSVSDLKEFWHVGRDLPDDDAGKGNMAPNLWPTEVDGFRKATSTLYRELDALGGRVLRMIAVGLQLPENFFDDVIDRGNSILRPLHYPPQQASSTGVRAAAHEDINLITLLVGSREAGLQILSDDDTWLQAPTGEELIICNVGDMLQRLTNHALPSATHRVVNPQDDRRAISRYSIPFFLHPNSDFLIETLAGCIDEARPNRYPVPILADDYLQERLREIGLV